jgi:hypothetical protein
LPGALEGREGKGRGWGLVLLGLVLMLGLVLVLVLVLMVLLLLGLLGLGLHGQYGHVYVCVLRVQEEHNRLSEGCAEQMQRAALRRGGGSQ